jgi:acetyltransferase-like isoleucine patch superfamily enzyme
MNYKIHSTAEIADNAKVGSGTSIWHQAQVRENVTIGKNCIIGKGVYIDTGVSIGDNTKIQNYVSVFHGVEIKNGVFIGPHVCFTNDLRPRAINPDGSLKDANDWAISKSIIHEGAAIGANSTIRCGITIGKWATIGAGSVVTHDIPDYGLCWGNPARLQGFVCKCGANLRHLSISAENVNAECTKCNKIITIPKHNWEKIND